jgi:hypothetical protein
MSITFWRTAGLLVISNTILGAVFFMFARTEYPERAAFKLSFVS